MTEQIVVGEEIVVQEKFKVRDRYAAIGLEFAFLQSLTLVVLALGLLLIALTKPSATKIQGLLIASASLFLLLAFSPKRKQYLELHLNGAILLAIVLSARLSQIGFSQHHFAVVQTALVTVGALVSSLRWAVGQFLFILTVGYLYLPVTLSADSLFREKLGLAVTALVSVVFYRLRRHWQQKHQSVLRSDELVNSKLEWLERETLQEEEAAIDELESLEARLEAVCSRNRDLDKRSAKIVNQKDDKHTSDLGRMVNGVAHDINNLLTIVHLNLSHLTQSAGLEGLEVTNELGEALKASTYMGSVVKQLVEFSATRPPSFRKLSLGSHFRDGQSVLSVILRDDLELEIVEVGSEQEVQADPYQLNLFLISVASQFNREAEPFSKMQIELDYQAQWCRMTLRDTGNVLGSIYRASSDVFSEEALSRGSGFTFLAVSSILSDLCEEFVISETGIECLVPYEGTKDSTESISESSVQKIDGSILLFEPEELIRKFLQRHLVNRGFSVTVFSEAETLHKVELVDPNPSVLIADYHGTGGPEAKFLKQASQKFPDLKFILFVCDASIPTPPGLECEKLLKPFSLESLDFKLGCHLAHES